jgi:hypothetical protein
MFAAGGLCYAAIIPVGFPLIGLGLDAEIVIGGAIWLAIILVSLGTIVAVIGGLGWWWTGRR